MNLFIQKYILKKYIQSCLLVCANHKKFCQNSYKKNSIFCKKKLFLTKFYRGNWKIWIYVLEYLIIYILITIDQNTNLDIKSTLNYDDTEVKFSIFASGSQPILGNALPRHILFPYSFCYNKHRGARPVYAPPKYCHDPPLVHAHPAGNGWYRPTHLVKIGKFNVNKLHLFIWQFYTHRFAL